MRVSEDIRKRAEERKAMHSQLDSHQPEDDSDDDKLLAGDGSSSDPTTVFLQPLSKGAFVMLRKTIQGLQQIQQKELMSLIATKGITNELTQAMDDDKSGGANGLRGGNGVVDETHVGDVD